MTAPAICLLTGTYPPSTGGLAKSGQRLARFLAAQGFDVHVVTPDRSPASSGEPAFKHESASISVYRVPFDFAPPAEGFALRRFLRELDQRHCFQLFHAFFVTYAYVCVEVAQSKPAEIRPPVLASIRGGDAEAFTANPFLRAQLVSALKRATAVTSVNQHCLSHFARWVSLEHKSSVIPNSIEPQTAGWELTGRNRGMVGTVGEFRAVKDIPLLIRAYQRLPSRLRRGLTLAGWFVDPPEREWSETLIDEFGLTTEVRQTGPFPQSSVRTHLAGMHLYVQSSAREGMPNALLEAAQMGLPLVATDVDGIRDWFTSGRDALLVPYGDPQSLSEAMEAVLADDRLAARLSAAAVELAARFTPASEQSAWLALYRRCLARVSKQETAAPALAVPGG